MITADEKLLVLGGSGLGQFQFCSL